LLLIRPEHALFPDGYIYICILSHFPNPIEMYYAEGIEANELFWAMVSQACTMYTDYYIKNGGFTRSNIIFCVIFNLVNPRLLLS
jgi:hypothetical protein